MCNNLKPQGLEPVIGAKTGQVVDAYFADKAEKMKAAIEQITAEMRHLQQQATLMYLFSIVFKLRTVSLFTAYGFMKMEVNFG